MFSVYQHWDPLEVCIVGRSYSPEFYDYITNKEVRKVFYRIAEETEEDYCKLIDLLKSFGVMVIRPEVSNNYRDYLLPDNRILPPPMSPRDHTAMIGNKFYIADWLSVFGSYSGIVKVLGNDAEIIHTSDKNLNTAQVTRIGRDLYFGTESLTVTSQELESQQLHYSQMFPEYRCHVLPMDGHSDGNYCPVNPGLIVSLMDIDYSKTYPGWEVVYLQNQGWGQVQSFLDLKKHNGGKWWVPGEELNNEFTSYVNHWMNDWVGYVEETVFDVNMLVIDRQNVVCNNYNEQVYAAFDKLGITAHNINFRHRYFWDGGLHCITSDVSRIGAMVDYFPERQNSTLT